MYLAMDMKSRKYDMGARQQAKTATRDAIIKAAIDTFMAERSFAITLPAVAERADVTVKTVLRHFGSRDALVEAAWSQAYDEVMAERIPPPDDPDAALDVLIAHYERRGEIALAMLGADENDARAAADEQRGHGSPIANGWRRSSRTGFPNRPPRAPGWSTSSSSPPTSTHGSYCGSTAGCPSTTSHDRMLLMTEALLAATHFTEMAGEAR